MDLVVPCGSWEYRSLLQGHVIREKGWQNDSPTAPARCTTLTGRPAETSIGQGGGPMSTVIVELQGVVATMRMNRPDRMNAYDFEMGKELLDAVSALGDDPGVRCIVLTGSGRAFSAGGDVALRGSFPPPAAANFRELTIRLHAFIASLRRVPRPVLSAVNGVAAGAGSSPAAGGAPAGGLAQRVFSDDSFEAGTAELAARIASGPTLAYAKAKELYNRALCQPLGGRLAGDGQG